MPPDAIAETLRLVESLEQVSDITSLVNVLAARTPAGAGAAR